MAFSEFSFTLEFIPGVENDIADAMSRLCRNNMVDSPQEYSEEHILSAISASTKPNEKIGKDRKDWHDAQLKSWPLWT